MLPVRTSACHSANKNIVAHLHPFGHGYVAAHAIRSVQHELAYVPGDGHERYRPGVRLLPAVGSVEAGYIHLRVGMIRVSSYGRVGIYGSRNRPIPNLTRGQRMKTTP